MDIGEAIRSVQRLPPQAAIAREAARLRRDEIEGSLAIDRLPLTREQLNALIDRGIATGEHRLEHYIAARDLAVASAWVAEQRPLGPSDPRPPITVEDVRRLHTLVAAGQPEMRPGVWRLAVEPADAGVVAPPPWLIAKETTALVDRFRRRPAVDDVPAHIAGFLARFTRIRPFAAANGRCARLAAALILRRLDVVPLAIARERSGEYQRAMIAAQTVDAQPLHDLVETALVQNCLRLVAAAGNDPLTPLRDLAGVHYAALIKAAKRGRLDVVARNGRVYTTAGWIARYSARYTSGMNAAV